MAARVGLGYDIHPLVVGRKLFLGGVEIPFPKGLKGHSDADVLLHAVCDALLGAVALGDIGEHFPNTDEKYRGISSLKLLAKVKTLVEKQGFSIQNIDTMIIAEEPHLKDHKALMRKNIAQTLDINETQVNIKATTQEGLGFPSGKEAIAAYAVVQLI